MTVYFGGGERTALNPSPNAIEDTSLAGASVPYDVTYARVGLAFTDSQTQADYWKATLQDPTTGAATSITTFGIHFDARTPNALSGGPYDFMVAFNSVGTAVFKVTRTALTYQMQYWDGSSWVNTGSTVALSNSGFYTLDFVGVCGASGSVDFHVNNSLQTSGSISDADCNNIAEIRLYQAWTFNVGTVFSQVIVADESTVGWKAYTKFPTSDSAVNVQWTGSYADVDEAVTNVGDFVESTAANDVRTYLGAALSLGTQVTVKAVIVSFVALKVATGPQNIQGAMRLSGTNYFGPSVSGLGSGYGAFSWIRALNPSTGVTWTRSEAASAAVEFGMKSIA
jgi:hypothetical protein